LILRSANLAQLSRKALLLARRYRLTPTTARRPSGRPAAGKLTHPYYVGHTTLDENGKGILSAPIPPGSYYLFCSANTAKGAMVWDLPITLKAGDNAKIVTAANAEIVK